MNDVTLKQIEKDSMDLVEQANKLKIRSRVDYVKVADFLKSIKGMIKKVNETFDPIIQKAKETLDEARARRDSHRDPLLNTEVAVKIELKRYDNEQERIRKENEDKMAAEAKAEEDRKRRAKEEQARRWREKEEAERKEAERLKKKGEEEEAEKARKRAEKASEKADIRTEEANGVHVVIPTVEKKTPKVDNITFKQRWDYRIIDANKIPKKYMIPDREEIRRLVVAGGGKWKCPGVEIFQVKDVVAGC